MGCIHTVNHFSNLYGMTVSALLIMGGLILGSKFAKRQGREDLSSILFNNLLIFTFLILPTISTKVMSTAGCELITDDDDIINSPREGYFLKIDRSIRCDSSDPR